ncbi:ATP-dependent nuclease [Priestia filamentosa]|uniref:ATP-dependent nuclease n=1 Tax=Priestia filamentosa TaxID=1402861 RepID=UPI000A08D657|nr:AAA family ATPase [Priestia filamentosa]OXS72074.1 ATP-dependent endonuclease [Priestia filamentosa]SMF18494.1 putative ATP-dependent endonuclease of the OLD family [Priestia filamentosa]
MNIPSAPYISRVKIKNFRNFKDVDVELSHKQVIIGENNVGKTNFLRALQLILDPKLSEEDRYLKESDFYEGLESPMENGEEILISIEIREFNHNRTLLSILSDATVNDKPATLRLTYQYYPTKKTNKGYEYEYRIYQGERQEVSFSHSHRKYLNIKVIPAMRDVESEMKHIKKSPINQLLKNYDIRKGELKEIADKLKETSDEVLSIDELVHLTDSINARFSNVIGGQVDSSISLETIESDPDRILNTLRIMIGQGKRTTGDTSLGISNILYISLILLSLEDKTIPPILKEDVYLKLLEEEHSGVVKDCYDKNEKGNYVIKEELKKELQIMLYEFMDNYYSNDNGFTILAIEEPESHLHPVLQRLIYKDVMKKNTSVLMTTHSPHITSVAPLESIVHLHSLDNGTNIKSTASLKLNDRERKDLARYIDVKKGELYFGKGIILIEGIAEEYLIPSFAELLHMPLDEKGIICCNVNSTNFKPYVQFLDELGIPYVVITDGDYYFYKIEKEEKKRKFGSIYNETHETLGYGSDGLERMHRMCKELKKIEGDYESADLNAQYKFFFEQGLFVGLYTMEIDMMRQADAKKSTEVFINVFNELTEGGPRQKQNFKRSLDNKEYPECLKKVESQHAGIGKGRFAQSLSVECTQDHIPPYIKNAIEYIYNQVNCL